MPNAVETRGKCPIYEQSALAERRLHTVHASLVNARFATLRARFVSLSLFCSTLNPCCGLGSTVFGEETLAKDIIKTKIQADGLRYKVKEGGSPFASAGDFQAGTMSCFLCGKHRPRNTLKTRRLLGKAQHVCAPSCKEAEAAGGSKPTSTVAA